MKLRPPVFNSFRFTLVGVAAVLLMLQACEKTLEIPARKITGTWTTAQPVYFFSASDTCTGLYQRYDSTPVSMTWVISYKKENLVRVKITADNVGETVSYDTCSLASNLPFPYELHGVVAQSTLVIEVPYATYDSAGVENGTAFAQVGSFNFTDNSLIGSLNDKVCDTLQCQGYETRVNSITLRRQE